jgi:phospholipid/cholesterol/gamma-HCH transport system substrate-binding protein
VTKEQKTDIRVGVTVLLGVFVLLAGIAWAKQWQFGSRGDVIRAVFPTAGGLERGDPVTVNGVKRGIVKELQVRQTDVVVTLALNDHVNLRRDASASIAMLELMGGKRVELRPGASTDPFPAGAFVPGIYSGDISSMIALVTSLSTTLESVVGKTDTLFTSLNDLFHGNQLGDKINRTLDAAQGTLGHIDVAATRASALLAENGPQISHTLRQADSALQYLTGAISENRAGLRVFIDSGGQAIADARLSLRRLDSILAGGSREKTLLYRLTRDEHFSMRIDSMLESLTKLSEQLRLQGLDANIRFFNSAKPVK